MAAEETLAEGSTFAGDYRVVRQIKADEAGTVYVVDQLSTRQRRALRLLHAGLTPDEESRSRFVEQALAESPIEAEHAAPVLGAGVEETSGAPYVVMEPLEGADLATYVQGAGALPPRQALEIMEQVALALGDAHEAGFVHGDLRPENLFLAKALWKQRDYVLKVLDFGIGRIDLGDRTSAEAMSAFGPPLWMAPEQAQGGEPLLPATDVWALGLITFQLLTARSYWLAANHPEPDASALCEEIMRAPLDPPALRSASLRARALPRGFDAWFARCVHRDPDQRFSSARDMFEALKPVLSEPGVIHAGASSPLRLDAISSSEGRSSAQAPARGEPSPAPNRAPAPQPMSPARRARLALAGAGLFLALGGGTASYLDSVALIEPGPEFEVDPPPIPVFEDPQSLISPSLPPAAAGPLAPIDVAGPPPQAERSPTGLAWRVLQPGHGSTHPGAADNVTVHYTGWTTDGEMFDSSHTRDRPASFRLDRVIAGWTEGLQLMVAGERRLFWIPGDLAYDTPGSTPRAGVPRGMLVFDVTLIELEVSPTAPAVPPDVAGPPRSAEHTASGLATRMLASGTGLEHPGPTSRVTVHYTGWTTDGEMFDSSRTRGRPASFPLNAVIPGWTEGLQLMVVGEQRRLWIPADLAYAGRAGAPAGMLVFDVELISFDPG